MRGARGLRTQLYIGFMIQIILTRDGYESSSVFCADYRSRGFFLAANAAIGQPERPQVTVDTGILVGTVDEAGVRVFRGIPYATPPVGELRWKEPQPVPAWNGVRDASRFGDRCQQTRFPAYIPIGNRGMSENCLYLNVWSAPGAVRRPVIVWIHGGGFGYGFSNQAAYDGSAFVQKGLVYVNLNYRVGAFGF